MVIRAVNCSVPSVQLPLAYNRFAWTGTLDVLYVAHLSAFHFLDMEAGLHLFALANTRPIRPTCRLVTRANAGTGVRSSATALNLSARPVRGRLSIGMTFTVAPDKAVVLAVFLCVPRTRSGL